MAADIVRPSDCYVYILYREDGITPFYVGKGRNDRWTEHERYAVRGQSYKDNIICKMLDAGISIPKKKVAEGISDEEALRIEIELIASIGRLHEGGPLANVTAGGEGMFSPTPEMRAKMRAARLGSTLSEEIRKKIGDAGRGRKKTPEHIAAFLASMTYGPRSDECKAKISASLAGRKNGPHSDETRARISAALTGISRPSQSTESNAKRSESLKLSWAAMEPEAKAKRGMAGKQHSEETKAKMREKALGRVISESQRAAVSAAQKGRKASPETRAKMAESQRRAQQARREREKMNG